MKDKPVVDLVDKMKETLDYKNLWDIFRQDEVVPENEKNKDLTLLDVLGMLTFRE